MLSCGLAKPVYIARFASEYYPGQIWKAAITALPPLSPYDAHSDPFSHSSLSARHTNRLATVNIQTIYSRILAHLPYTTRPREDSIALLPLGEHEEDYWEEESIPLRRDTWTWRSLRSARSGDRMKFGQVLFACLLVYLSVCS